MIMQGMLVIFFIFSVSSIFFNLGSFVAKAFLDSRQLDIQFNPWFLNQVFSNVKKESLSIMKFSDEALLNIKVCFVVD